MNELRLFQCKLGINRSANLVHEFQKQIKAKRPEAKKHLRYTKEVFDSLVECMIMLGDMEVECTSANRRNFDLEIINMQLLRRVEQLEKQVDNLSDRVEL